MFFFRFTRNLIHVPIALPVADMKNSEYVDLDR